MNNSGNLLIGVSVGVTLWNILKSSSKQQSTKVPNHEQSIGRLIKIEEEAIEFNKNLSQKMQKFKINDPPTLDQCQQILYQVFQYSVTNVIINSLRTKKKRIFLKRNQPAEWIEYFKVLLEWFQENSGLNVKSKLKAYQNLNINPEVLSNYKQQLIPYKKSLGDYGMTFLPFIPTLKLQQTREILIQKTKYLEIHGQRLVERIIQVVIKWPENQRKKFLLLLSIIINDEALSQIYPELDQFEIQCAIKQHQQQLKEQIDQYITLRRKYHQELTQAMQLTP